jgi:hypothetical protein
MKKEPVKPYFEYKFQAGSPTRKSDLRTQSTSPIRKSRTSTKKSPMKSEFSSPQRSPKRGRSPVKRGVNPYAAPTEEFIHNKEEILALLKENQGAKQNNIGKIN